MKWRPSPAVVAGTASVALLLTAGILPVRAQISMPQPGNPSSYTSGPVQVGPPPKPKAVQPPPAALPGAAPRPDTAAPAQGGPIADPTEALFDAINRGDIAAARDAVDRGADLSGQNILGMTPLEESIDLGRNDITFLLLSLRQGEVRMTGKEQAPGSTAASGLARAGTKSPPAKTVAQRVVSRQTQGRPTPVPVRTQAGPPPAQQMADTGTPNPQAGFLGFGPSR
jgi:hypothetical protein